MTTWVSKIWHPTQVALRVGKSAAAVPQIAFGGRASSDGQAAIPESTTPFIQIWTGRGLRSRGGLT